MTRQETVRLGSYDGPKYLDHRKKSLKIKIIFSKYFGISVPQWCKNEKYGHNL
jgi:hypothetical protein